MKSRRSAAGGHAAQVTPRAGVWIEIQRLTSSKIMPPVTPRAGVWIEIWITFAPSGGTPVTPRAGVWIEMVSSRTLSTGRSRHTPCGCVD